jgi:hypothetical protein
LWLLRTALTKRLRELRTNAESRVKPQTQNGVAVAGGPRRIYLHSRPEHTPACEEVKRVLSEDGIAPLTAAAEPGRDMADWSRESKTRIETAKRCEALALVRVDNDERFVGDLLDIGVDERERIQSARGALLPCAVLDQTGLPLPIDVSAFGIERFDIGGENWPGKFRGWLDNARAQRADSP